MNPAGTRHLECRSFALFVAAFFVAWSLRATVFYAIDESIAAPQARALYAAALKFLLWVVPALLFAALVRKAPAARYLGITHWPDARAWMVCVAGTAAFFLAVGLFETAIGGRRLSAQPLLALPASLLVLHHVLSPLLEETLFRGLVMKELMARHSVAAASALCSLLFVGIHLPYWLTHGEVDRAMLANLVGIFLFSNVACWLYARSRSVWPPTLAHVGNNLLAALLVAGK